jgi:conjugal transfer pilus assembly protein TraB
MKIKVILFGAGLITVLALSLWAMSSSGKKQEQVEKVKKDITEFEPDLSKDDFYNKAKEELAKKDERISDLEKRLSAIESSQKSDSQAEGNPDSDIEQNVPPDEAPIVNTTLPALPEPVNEPASYQPPPPLPSAQYAVSNPPGDVKQVQPVVMGDIAVVSNGDKAEEDVKKKKGKRLYLPPSIIPADLLSGLDAHTAQDSDKNPTPALFRIRKLAILPNEVKANLKGCFVLGEGIGRLDSERVEIRLITLACVDFNGNAIIDQQVKGYVVDEDGKVGLRGHMVAKFGSMVARSALAGFVEGIGSATQAAFQDVSVSPDGVVTSTDKTKDVIGAGIGGAIEGAGKQVGRFYIDLAKQTLPVIEVGATKVVTLITTEGVELILKDEYCVGDESCEEEQI